MSSYLPARYNITAYQNSDFEQEFVFSEDFNVADYSWYCSVEKSDKTLMAEPAITVDEPNNSLIVSLEDSELEFDTGMYIYSIWINTVKDNPIILGSFNLKYGGRPNGD